MTSRSIVYFPLVVAAAALSVACIPSPTDKVSDSFENHDAPIVEILEIDADFVSQDVPIDFRVYDSDSEWVILWDECPYPDLEGAEPILRIGYSEGGSFQPIDPADLTLNGEPLTVPTCSQVKSYDESLRIAVTGTADQHTLVWSTLPYIPSAAEVTFRIAADDGSFASEPGDAEFVVANLPFFDVLPRGIRPNESLSVELSGVLTHWDGTTTVSSSGEITVTDLVILSSTAATATFTHSGDTDQVLREVVLTTPGAGIPSGDENAPGEIWTCPEVGEDVISLEVDQAQFVCDQGAFTINGSLAAGDTDAFTFVANSAGLAAMTLDWTSSDGAATDYDMYMLDAAGNLMHTAAPFGLGPCGTEDKPESCAIETPLVPGEEYTVFVTIYTGETENQGVTYTATVTPP